MKFYKLDSGWATKYFWFDIIENFPPSEGKFIKRIKDNELTFTKQSGTTHADVHCSTMTINFFSEKFVNFLREQGIKNFKAYKIKFVPEMQNIGNYYYLGLNDIILDKVTWNKIHSTLKDNVSFSIKNWNNQKIFGIFDTRYIIVTEDLKNLIEKQKFKNIKFEEIVPV